MTDTKRVTEIKKKLITWCKETHYDQGDDYYAKQGDNGVWIVGYSNDYPLQHGKGQGYKITKEQLIEMGI